MRKTVAQKGKTDRRTMMRNSIRLPMAAMLLAAALAGPAVAADRLVPFSGSLHAKEFIVLQGVPPGTFVADGSGGGIATLPCLVLRPMRVSGVLSRATRDRRPHFHAATRDAYRFSAE